VVEPSTISPAVRRLFSEQAVSPEEEIALYEEGALCETNSVGYFCCCSLF